MDYALEGLEGGVSLRREWRERWECLGRLDRRRENNMRRV